MSKVALITAYNGQGQLLVGKRNDSGKYTLPGGHLEEGEDPKKAALRELHEETGLRAMSLSYLTEYVLDDGTELHCFSAFVTGEPHGKNDPDKEVTEWEFVDVEEGLPSKVYNNLAGPQDEQNIVTKLFDLEKAEEPAPPKLKLKAAFRHPETKHVVATGSFHDLGHPDMPTENAHEYESGFVDPTGKFYTRREAAQAINPTNAQYQNYLHLDSANLAGDYRKTGDVFRGLSPNGAGRYDDMEKHEDRVYSMDEVAQATNNFGGDPGAADTIAMNAGHDNTSALKFRLVDHPVDQLQTMPTKPKKVRALREAIRAGTKLPPIVVGSDNVVVDGNHRTEAHRAEGMMTVPAFHLLDGLAKAQDEVFRLLEHPDPVEKLLALKLDTVRPEHVLHAALDPDPSVHGPALDHPKFGPNEAVYLMEAAAGHDGAYPAAQKAAFMARNRMEAYHFTALARAAAAAGPAEHAAAAASIAAHPKAPSGLLRSMYLDPNVIQDSRIAILSHPSCPIDVLDHAVSTGLTFQGGTAGAAAAAAATHASLPTATLKALVLRAADRGEPHAVTIACTALRGNGGITPDALADLFQDLLPRAVTKPGSPAPQLLAALLRNPSASPALAGQAYKALPPGAQAAMLETPHLQAVDLDTLVVHAHRTKNKDLLAQVMDHPAFGPRHLNLMLQKAEDDLLKPNTSPLKSMASHPVISHQLGFEPAHEPAFRAAKFLAGRGEAHPDLVRDALYQEDGDCERAALLAYGIPCTEDNLKALRSVAGLSKAEFDAPEPQPTAEQVITAHPEAEDVADAVRRAFKDGMVFPVALGGKHSKGSIIAHDPQSKVTLLLKSGSGGAGGAAGSKQDPSNPNAREAAFYYVAKDWNIAQWYPRAELILVDGKPYAVLQLLPLDYTTLDHAEKKEPGLARLVLAPHLYDGQIHQWATIDYVCGNPDRHGQNVMIDPKRDIRLIDHGSAFAGTAFDPAHDKGSFVPYYLRAWALGQNFHQLSDPDKLKNLPRVAEAVARKLAQWVLSVSPEKLTATCTRYGIDPGPTLERLKRVQDGVSAGTPLDLVVNQLWSTT